MRALLYFLILISSGCSPYLIYSGEKLEYIQYRSSVHSKFGTPITTCEKDGQLYEEYFTRKKISEPLRIGPGIAMFYVATLGLGEMILLPSELFKVARRSLIGQRLRFTYDNEGNVIATEWDNHSVALMWKINRGNSNQIADKSCSPE